MQIFCTLVGASFRGKEACDIIRSLDLSDGPSLSLEPEPDNEYDDNAVKVLQGDTHLGYIAKAHNPPVFDALAEGRDIIIEIVAFENNLKPVLQLHIED